MNFRENLIKLRKGKGLSQEELGSKINVSRQTISKWELGETTPEMEKLWELAKLFEVSIDELVGNDSYKKLGGMKKNFNFSYEYKSKGRIGKVPLVHINVGKGQRTAKGIIAIGNKAWGFISIGGIALGLLSLGGLSLGVFSLAGISIGLLLAVGGIALGLVSLGGLSIGVFAIGGLAIGIYSIGGLALARNIACGGYARGHIAIGQCVEGIREIVVKQLSPTLGEEIRQVIWEEFPKTWDLIVDIYSNLF